MSNVQLVAARLNELTQEGSIEWKRIKRPSGFLAPDDRVKAMFETSFKGKKLVLFEHEFEAFNEETEQLYWTSELRLAFVNEQGEKGYQFPRQARIYDLWETVQYLSSGVGDFLNDLFE